MVTTGGATANMRKLLIGLGAMLAVGLGLGPSPASAVVERPLLESFGPDGTAGTAFLYENQIGFDQARNRLYVMPQYPEQGPGTDGLYAFHMPAPGTHDPLGEPFPLSIPTAGYFAAFTIDNSATASAGRIYQQSNGVLYAWDPDGNPLGPPFPLEPTPPDGFCEVAVDSAGNIALPGGILRYSSLGVPLPRIDTQKFHSSSCFIAFDSQDNLLVAADNQIWKYTAASDYTQASPIATVGGPFVVDRSNDHIFLNRGESILELDSTGTQIGKFGKTYGVRGYFHDVVVNEDTNEIYVLNTGVLNAGGQLQVFGPPTLLPTATTKDVRDVTTTGATLNGEVDLDGGPVVTECFFEYGLDVNYQTGSVPCTPAATPGGPFEATTAVSAQIAGLEPGVKYHYRLVAKSANGVGMGDDQTFFAVNPPVFSGEKVVEVTADHAVLDGIVNAQGAFTSVAVEYGPEDCAISACLSTELVPLIPPCGFCGSDPPPKLKTDLPLSIELNSLTP